MSALTYLSGERMNTRTDIISVAQAASLLRSDPAFVFSLVLRGELKPVGNGPEIFLSRTAVQRYLDTHPRVATRSEKDSIIWH